MNNSFGARATLTVADKTYEIFRLDALEGTSRLPFPTKVLLENLLRNEDGVTVTKEDIEKLADWDSQAEPNDEIQYRPARVLMQDFTGVPAIVDLAAMRDAMERLRILAGPPETWRAVLLAIPVRLCSSLEHRTPWCAGVISFPNAIGRRISPSSWRRTKRRAFRWPVVSRCRSLKGITSPPRQTRPLLCKQAWVCWSNWVNEGRASKRRAAFSRA